MSLFVKAANIPGHPVNGLKHFEAFESAAKGLWCQEELLADNPSDARRRFLVWRAPQALIVGPTDSRLSNFAAAASRLRAEGWPVIARHSGGSACPISDGTLQVVIAQPATSRFTIEAAYEELANLICAVLHSYGLAPVVGTVSDSFCPGRFDISISGRKVAGLSQRWHRRKGRMTVTTASTLIVDACVRDLAQVVNRFYQVTQNISFCSESAIGSLCQFLPDRFIGDKLLDDVSRRLALEWSAEGSARSVP